MDLYMRKISLIAGSKTIEQPLTIHFEVSFDDSTEVNDVEITVYNLKDSTVNSIKKGDRFILTAGYRDDSGTIFQGILKRKETTWEGVDKITTFYCIDDEGKYMTDKIKKTFERGTIASKILIEDLENQALLLELIVESLPELPFSKRKTKNKERPYDF